MERKVIQLAGKTYVVSLPTKFVKKHKITKGQTVHAVEQRGGIFISTGEQEKPLAVHINLDSLGKFDKNYIGYLYQKGYDEIRLSYDDPTIYPNLARKTESLLGFEIVEERESACTLRAVSQASRTEFETVLRRTFLLLLQMSEMCLELLEDIRNAAFVIDLEKANNKLTDFLKRVLNKHEHVEAEKTTFYYSLVRDLEKIADAYRGIAEHLLTNPPLKNDKKTRAYFAEVNSFLRLFYELFYKFEGVKSRDFLTRRDYLLGRYKELLMVDSEHVIVSQLGMIVHHVAELYGPYFSIMIA